MGFISSTTTRSGRLLHDPGRQRRWLAFDDQPLWREFERQGFVRECGVTALLILEEFRTSRLRLYPFVLWRNACRPGAPLTPELLDEFRHVNIWDYTPPAYHINRDLPAPSSV